MLLEFILLSIIFCYRNSKLAISRGQNAVLWSILTVVAMFILMMVTLILYVFICYGGDIFDQKELASYFNESIFRVLTVYMLTAGGGLAIGYILEYMPIVNKKK